MSSDSAAINADGMVFPQNLQRNIGYLVEIPEKSSFNSSYPAPALLRGRQRLRYLQIPEDIKPELDKVLADIFPEGYQYMTPVEKAAGISRYLQENYTYSLYPKHPKGMDVHRDPVINFLSRTKQGHCELFASAAALLMRRVGIPSRYVSGVICSRKSNYGNYYFATGDNLHAWLEIYLQNAHHPVW